MRKSARLISRWTVGFVALTVLLSVLAACSGSSSPEADREAVTLVPEPTGTTSPPGATATPGAAAVPVVAAQSPGANGSRSTSGSAASPPQTQSADGALSALADADYSDLLAAFEQALNSIYENVRPSVVYIRVPNPAASALQGLQGVPDELLWGAGSGFVWDDEGHIVTNHHVVEDLVGSPDEVTVIFADSTQATGQVIGSDPHSDLAVIKLRGDDWELQPVALGDSSAVRVGQLAVAIGAPFGQEFTLTSGIVSAVGRNISGQSQFTIPEVIQTDAAINPGNSGGPLLDRFGHVIGINTQIISRSGSFSGVGMAVPVNIAKRVVPPLIEDGKFDYPWVGVNIATVTSNYVDELELPEGTKGALIVAVVGDSPAARAGLRGSDSSIELDGVEYPSGGDIIMAVDSRETAGSSQLIAHLLYHSSPGDTVTLTVLRDGQREEIRVTLGQRPDLP